LDSPMLEQVVAVYAENERIEAFLAANAKSANALSYRIAPGTPEIATLSRMFSIAAANLTRARAALDSAHHAQQSCEPMQNRVPVAACSASQPRPLAA